MLPIPYKAEDMDHVLLLGKDGTTYDGQYTDVRIDKATVPNGYYAYECRHNDFGDYVTPVTIEKKVLVNFAGTFITNTQLQFPDDQDPHIPLNGFTLIE